MGSSGISVGDAVLNFISDTSQLDQTFASLPGKAKAGLQPVQDQIDGVSDDLKKVGDDAEETLGERVPEAAELTRKEMSEARGEVRLLGEEFGIHLPRHVANFAADLPGVGEAMSAAFDATAIFILIRALVEGTEKLSDFLGGLLIYTAADKAAHKALVEHEQAVAKQVDAYNKAKAALDEYGKSQLEISSDKIDALNASIREQNQIVYDNTQRLGAARLGITAYSDAEKAAFTDAKELAQKTAEALKEQLALQQKIASDQANETALKSLREEISLREKLNNVQITFMQTVGLDKDNADELRYQASLKALKEQAAAEAKYGKDSVDRVKQINAEIEAAEANHALKIKEELDKANEALDKTFTNLQKEVGKNTVGALQEVSAALTPTVKHMLELRKEAGELGITLKVDLEDKLLLAKKALLDLQATMGASPAEIAVFKKAVEDAANALAHLGQTEDKFKAHNDNTFKNLEASWKNGAQGLENLQKMGVQTFDQLSKGLESAVAGAILGQESFGKALEKSTAQALASLAAQALVKALFYTAEGVASLAMMNYGGAAQFFTAAGEMAAVGGAAGVTARAMSGSTSGSGGGSTTQSQSSSVDTGGSTRSTIGVTGVQKMAVGGLIQASTLAVVGEAGAEAVLPLEDPRAMERVGKAIRGGGDAGGAGGDSHLHVNVRGGMISPDNLTKVVNQINRKVGQGRMQLRSSNTLRITKRSA